MKKPHDKTKPIIFASFIALTACSTMNQPDEFTHDGLRLESTKPFDATYKKPDVDIKQYNSFMISECSVAFRKNWQRDQNTAKGTGTSQRISDADMEAIKLKLAAMCHEVFVEELQKEGGYTIVESAGPHVLELKPNIIDLDIVAPDTLSAGRGHTYTTSEGSMRLFLEAYDSVSGEILARVIDRSVASSGSQLEWTNSITNSREAKRMLSRWGALLRSMIDSARSE